MEFGIGSFDCYRVCDQGFRVQGLREMAALLRLVMSGILQTRQLLSVSSPIVADGALKPVLEQHRHRARQHAESAEV